MVAGRWLIVGCCALWAVALGCKSSSPSTASSDEREQAETAEDGAGSEEDVPEDVPSSDDDAAQGDEGALEKLPPLDTGRVSQAKRRATELEELEDRGARQRLAAALLQQLEEGRLPKQVLSALDAVAIESVGLSQRNSIVYRAVKGELKPGWKRACDVGRFGRVEKVLASAASHSVDAREKVRIIYGSCQLGRLDLVPLDALTADHGALALAHALWGYLEATGSGQPIEERLLRTMVQSGEPLAEAIEPDDLPKPDDHEALEGESLEALRKRIDQAIALLENKQHEKFLRELISEEELKEYGGSVEELAKEFAESGKAAQLLGALRAVRTKPAAVEDDGKTAILIPPDPPKGRGPGKIEWELVDGTWYMRN